MSKAILLSKNLTPKTHTGVISNFGEQFIKTYLLPKKLAKYLKKSFEVRLLGDYNISVNVEKENAKDLIEIVKEFNSRILDYLKQNRII